MALQILGGVLVLKPVLILGGDYASLTLIAPNSTTLPRKHKFTTKH